MDRTTVEVYEQRGLEWAAGKPARYIDEARALAAASLPGMPVLDAGCGAGAYLPLLGDRVVALDAAATMLAGVQRAAPGLPRVQGDLLALPFRDRSLGGAWARASYMHLPKQHLPLALARLHWALAPGAPLWATLTGGDDEGPFEDDRFTGRFFARWRADRLAAVLVGAGFDVESIEQPDDEWLVVRATRARTLPDIVGPGMRALVCGLNPSLVAADAGVGFAGPTNRFWAAAIEAGLVSRAHDPLHALTHHRVGMTDLVKRATIGADELDGSDYRDGAARVRSLVEWLCPGVVVFVGLAGYRAAVDRAAVAGRQPEPFGGSRAYVLPSTSGRNASSNKATLVAHLREALALA